MSTSNMSNIDIFQNSPDKRIRDTGQFSYFSTDTSSNDEDIESELFNDENLFTSDTTNLPGFSKLKSPQKMHTRFSMRIKNDDDTRISMFKTRYSQSNMNSKISLADITNTSNMSFTNSVISRRTSNLSNQSKRNYSFSTENGSAISLEKKRNQIIQRLNKRNSKNLSNPYFYQYKENTQPHQAPPEPPEEDLILSNTNSTDAFSDFFNNNSTEESLHFVDKKFNNHSIFPIAEDSQADIGSRAGNLTRGSNRNSNSYNNTRNDDTHNTSNASAGNHTGNTGNSSNYTGDTSNNTGNTGNSSHYTSQNTTNGTESSKNTNSGSDDTTSSSEEANLSRRIRTSQQTYSGVFSEMSFVSSTAPLVMTTINKSPHIPQIVERGSNDVHDVTQNEPIERSDKVAIDTTGLNPNTTFNTTKSSIDTVSTGDLQHDQFSVETEENTVNDHEHSNVYASPFSNPNLLLPDNSKHSPVGPILTVRNMNNGSHSDDSNESRLKDFNLSNNSSVSVFFQAKTPQRTDSQPETILEHASHVHKYVHGNDKKKGKMSRKPPPPNMPGRIFNHSDNSSGSYINVASNNQPQPRIPSMVYDQDQSIQLQSDQSDTTQDSNTTNGSRDQLLSSGSKNTHKKVRIDNYLNNEFNNDLEKAQLTDDVNYRRRYHDYTYSSVCSTQISLMLVIFSFLAPPFWLLIYLGFLDKHFGVVGRSYKIASATLFGVFLVGAIVGIGVGFGYGLTH